MDEQRKPIVLKSVKITNPLYIGQIAQHVQAYHKRTKPVGVTYETLYSYFANIVQFGGNMSEFHVAFEADENERMTPYGFAMWAVMGPPNISKVHCGHLYSWGKSSAVARALVSEFFEFGKRHNALLYDATAINKNAYDLFKRICNRFGYEVLENERINFCVRKVN